LIGQDQIGDALHPGSIAPIFKRIAQWIGIPRRFVAQMSGHSTRVGAAQDLAELDIDDPSYVPAPASRTTPATIRIRMIVCDSQALMGIANIVLLFA
jgi:hypothetical protein